MNTIATSFPVAAVCAALRSVSLRDEDTVAPSVLALVVMASNGYVLISSIEGSNFGRLTVMRYGYSAVPEPHPNTDLSDERLNGSATLKSYLDREPHCYIHDQCIYEGHERTSHHLRRNMYPFIPWVLGPAPLPMIPMVFGAFNGRRSLLFLRRTVPARAICRTKLYTKSVKQEYLQEISHVLWSP